MGFDRVSPYRVFAAFFLTTVRNSVVTPDGVATMRCMKACGLFLLVGSLLLQSSCTQDNQPVTPAAPATPVVVPAKEAKSKVGETIVVEGRVAEVNKSERIIRLNLDEKFPKQEFTLVIFQRSFEAFPDVEKLTGKTVRANGKVTEYQGRAQLVLERKEQLSVAADPKADEKPEKAP